MATSSRSTRPEDRRTSERIDARLRVRLGVSELDRSELAENISEGGLFVRTNDVFPVGSRLLLAVQLDEQHTQHFDGEVMWAIRVPEHQREFMMHGMGIQFLNHDPGWKALFAAWKARRAAGLG